MNAASPQAWIRRQAYGQLSVCSRAFTEQHQRCHLGLNDLSASEICSSLAFTFAFARPVAKSRAWTSGVLFFSHLVHDVHEGSTRGGRPHDGTSSPPNPSTGTRFREVRSRVRSSSSTALSPKGSRSVSAGSGRLRCDELASFAFDQLRRY